MSSAERIEEDLLGERSLPEGVLYGIHTLRASENFPLMKRPVHPELIRSYALVKMACVRTNAAIGVWKNKSVPEAIERACEEMASGGLDHAVIVDALQGGAGTSLNMNVNEVLANRAIEILGGKRGQYTLVSPADDVNRHQSTNDTFPTALRLAAIRLLRGLEGEVVTLQESFQKKEMEFADVVKVGRTQLQDAVLTTLGREMSAYAEAFSRDRWRIYKCEERLRVINLGGTAIGTGTGAPREFIFRVVDTLRDITGTGFARAENLVEATQNADVYVEVSGMLKSLAVSLFKCAGDLRLLSSGPDAGLGELSLPERQSGSSIMPGKVNPVIPEAVSQAALIAIGNDHTTASAAALGNLELNQFLPLIAHCLLESISILTRACGIFRDLCVRDMSANRDVCARHVNSSTAAATALVGRFGYDRMVRIVRDAGERGITIRQCAVEAGLVTDEEFSDLVSAEAVMRLGQ